ncbi:MAG: cytochrome c3 family protein [Thermodesulfovibrionales bacterium]
MKLKNKWLYVIAFILLVIPIAFSVSTTWAVYLSDGASQNGNTGGWNLPADMGQCVTGIAADGVWTVDETIKSRPDCISRTWPAYTTQEACGSASGKEAHFWANTCVANDGTPISLKGLDRTAAMCNQAAIAAGKTSGTWSPACTSAWQYMGRDLKADNGFCYGTMRLAGYTVDTCPITTPGYSWDSINGKCLYAYGIKGEINGDIKDLSGTILLSAGNAVDMRILDTMGKCLLYTGGSSRGVAGWNNYTTKTGTNTDHGVTMPVGLEGGTPDCLRCHNTTSQYNGYAERWKETYLKTGHKNMLRKVTAGQKWAGPCPEGQTANRAGLCVYASDGTSTINWENGTINVNGTDRQLFYIFGDWMAPDPYTVYANPAGGMVTNGYACASCHATGWSNASAGLCSKSSKLTEADCAAAEGTWYPSSGTQGVAGKEPQESFPGIGGITGTWDQDGIVCSRCHASTWPAVYSGATAITSTHNLGTAISGASATNLCFGCHQSLATDYSTGDKILDPVQIPTGGSHGAVWAREFNGHVLGNQFLNSPHGAFKGAAVPNSLGKYDLVSGGTFGTTFGDIFCRNNNADGTPNATGGILTTNADGTKIKTSTQCTIAGGTWWIGQTQGSCSTCHDVHQSLVPEVGSDEPLKRECIDCHTDKADLSKINHPSGVGTPLEHGTLSCEVCHMPKPTSEGYPMHLWRINADAAYDTFPSQAEFYGGICSKNPMASDTGYPVNTAPDLCAADLSGNGQPGVWTAAVKDRRAKAVPDITYANAVWVDIDLACGQCHGGSKGQSDVKNKAPYMDKATLAYVAVNTHLNEGYNIAPKASMELAAIDRSPAVSGIQIYTVDTVTVTDASLDLNGDLSSITVDWGDTTSVTIAPGGTATHTYSSTGDKTITLTATDSEGFKSIASRSVSAMFPPPGVGSMIIMKR